MRLVELAADQGDVPRNVENIAIVRRQAQRFIGERFGGLAAFRREQNERLLRSKHAVPWRSRAAFLDGLQRLAEFLPVVVDDSEEVVAKRIVRIEPYRLLRMFARFAELAAAAQEFGLDAMRLRQVRRDGQQGSRNVIPRREFLQIERALRKTRQRVDVFRIYGERGAEFPRGGAPVAGPELRSAIDQ